MNDIEKEISIKSLKHLIRSYLRCDAEKYSDILVEKLLYSEEPITVDDMITTYPRMWEIFDHYGHKYLLKIELIKDIDKVSCEELKKIL